MSQCKHEFFRMSEFGELFCDACCESQYKILADMLVDSDTKLSEARADALKYAKLFADGFMNDEFARLQREAHDVIAKYEEK